MAFPTALLGAIAKGLFGFLSKVVQPLALLFAGKKIQENKSLKEAHEQAKENAKLNDGVSRATDDELDRVLND